MKKIVIVDYGLGNLRSITRAFDEIGFQTTISKSHSEISEAVGVVLPGVGAFPDAMNRINLEGLNDVLRMRSAKGRSILGVCLGMQLLFESSEEFGHHGGLGLMRGSIKRLPNESGGHSLRVPFIGWNEFEFKTDFFAWKGGSADRFYLVHSYHASCEKRLVVSEAIYQGFSYPTIVRDQNLIGIQGHPEKSGLAGLSFYKEWAKQL